MRISHHGRWLPGTWIVLLLLAGGGCENQVASAPHAAAIDVEAAGDAVTAGDMVTAGDAGPDENDGHASDQEPGQPVEIAMRIPDAPFPRRIKVPEFPPDMQWINSRPLKLENLKGKFVLLDFWTYCCINCIHVLPELKKLERAYPNELVVIGVHCAKFEAEKNTENIKEAVLRYEIEHPVINDLDHRIWKMFGVSSWPTIWLIDPEGYAVYSQPGENKFESLDKLLNHALPFYRESGLLDGTPVEFDLAAKYQDATPLRFPGKVLADEQSDRLYISDSNHNRIVITQLDGTLIDIMGNGAIGRDDGDYRTASFHHPQGMALDGDTLFVSDTENHLIRRIDLAGKQVTTIAGTGVQGRNAWPGSENLGAGSRLPKRPVGQAASTAINSPWALWVREGQLYIAMAGPHQIWKMDLDRGEIGPYAGNGREDIVDGRLLPRRPYQTGYSSFAQPSGLASDGTWLFVADSEGASIRAVPLDPTQSVKTLVGTSRLPGGRLFAFGDVDGNTIDVTLPSGLTASREVPKTCLQHPLGVVFHDAKIYVADTYNNKIKVIDPTVPSCLTLVGTGEPGADDEPGRFDEPAGISYAAGKLYVADTNNHLIRTVDLKDANRVATLRIDGLTAPIPPKP